MEHSLTLSLMYLIGIRTALFFFFLGWSGIESIITEARPRR
jgi:hypothetical protein